MAFICKAPIPLLLLAWVFPNGQCLSAIPWADLDAVVRIIASICAIYLAIHGFLSRGKDGAGSIQQQRRPAPKRRGRQR